MAAKNAKGAKSDFCVGVLHTPWGWRRGNRMIAKFAQATRIIIMRSSAERAKSAEQKLFYAGGLKILEFDETVGSGQGLFQQSGFSHEGDHLAEAIDVDLALHRQDMSLRFEK